MGINLPEPSDSPEKKSYTPYESILLAFFFYSKESLDLDSLVRIARTANCPSDQMAQTVLANMVNQGYLTWSKKDGKVSFQRTPLGIQKTPEPPPGPIPATAPNN